MNVDMQIKEITASEHNLEQAYKMEGTKKVSAFLKRLYSERERMLIDLGRYVSSYHIKTNQKAYEAGLDEYKRKLNDK